jgi:hypothetical protein
MSICGAVAARPSPLFIDFRHLEKSRRKDRVLSTDRDRCGLRCNLDKGRAAQKNGARSVPRRLLYGLLVF